MFVLVMRVLIKQRMIGKALGRFGEVC